MARNLPEHSAHFHEHGLHLPTRTMWIDGELNSEDEFELTSVSVRRDIKNLHTLDSMGTGNINVIMNCNGGDTLLGMAIYDAIRQCKNFVRITVYGKAYSMGSIILQAADERVMAPNAVMMIHSGEIAYSGAGKAVDNERKLDKKVDELQELIYLAKIKQKKPRFTRDQLQKLLEHDTYLTAKEAVELGLADKVLETE
jgi:ATP-dependent Clp protease protease subunit